MAGWMVMTLRARPASAYKHTESDGIDPVAASDDLGATAEADDRVFKWTQWGHYTYVYLDGMRGDFEAAERVLADYAPMVQDAVILSANNTSDTGVARYYPDPVAGGWTDEYQEEEARDGHNTGEIALAHITANNGIVARDPFHNRAGDLDEYALEDGTNRLD